MRAAFPALLFLGSIALAACSSSPDERSGGGADSLTRLDLQLHPEWRGLLASPQLQSQPVKGVFFYPGETRDWCAYTAHPTLPEDQHWNSQPGVRAGIVDRMVATHANVVVMSYWGLDQNDSSPMVLDGTSVPGLIASTVGKPIVVLPAIESGPAYDFENDAPNVGGPPAPGLLHRIDLLMGEFAGHMSQWAQIYDPAGAPRYAINILHARSNRLAQVGGDADDKTFAKEFDRVAGAVFAKYGVWVGFTLDVTPYASYVLTPSESGAALAQTYSVLGVQSFNSAVWVEQTVTCDADPPVCGMYPPYPICPRPVDNNATNFANLVGAEGRVRDWVPTGVPVIADMSSGFDGRIIWRKDGGAGFWGDNEGGPYDPWRNEMSMLKGGGIRGATFDTWNGYTEGYHATPTTEHGTIVQRWLTDFFSADPRVCDHWQYQNGFATNHVYGAICDKWGQMGAYLGILGGPRTSELPSPGGRGRIDHFDGGAILWGAKTGAHEVHGIIGSTYATLSPAFDASCLGLPTSDELGTSASPRWQYFEGGNVVWFSGDTRGRVSCTTPLP